MGHGGWAALLTRSSRLSTDVLLPRLTSEADSDASYSMHWRLNSAFTSRVRPEHRAWSLVCVGRYSLTFLLGTMAPQWSDGVIAYEEISLPTSCLAHSNNCTVAPFGTLVDARRVRFRPSWDCAKMQNMSHSTGLAFWHPVKQIHCETSTQDSFLSDHDPFVPVPPPSPPVVPPTMPEAAAAEFSFKRAPTTFVVSKPKTTSYGANRAWKVRSAKTIPG